MNQEIILYFSILFLNTIFILFKIEIKGKKSFFCLVFFIFLSLSLFLRFSPLTSDFNEYTLFLQSDLDDISDEQMYYYLREGLYWFSSYFLYQLLDNEIYVYITFDMIAYIFVFFALKNFGVPQNYYFGVMYSFPFILGMQNIYRQWIATCILLFVISLKENQTFKKYFFFTCSLLVHNSMGLFLSLLLINNQFRQIRILGVILLCLTPLFIYLGLKTKANELFSGFDFSILYFYVNFFITSFLLFNSNLSININLFYIRIWFFNLVVSTSMFLMTNQVPFERVSIIILSILYPLLAFEIEKKFIQKKLIHFFNSTFWFLIMFISGASYVLQQ